MRYENLIKNMSLEEKASLCVGKDYWHTKNIERLNIPSIMMCDGPNGLRIHNVEDDNWDKEAKVATCFPTLATLSNSWDTKVAFEMGKAIGSQAAQENVDIVLGPAINIKRSPLCGRNFEYISEDPYLAGAIGSAYVNGLQENKVGACVKHFAVNNQENNRQTINVVVDERALREIYLKAFEIVVKNSHPTSIMSAYNKINGSYCTENKKLMDILRKEWNFDGIVISDWGAENNRVDGLLAGNELEMPGISNNSVQDIIDSVNSGEISENLLDELVDNLLTVILKDKNHETDNIDYEKFHVMALKIAEDCIVLLKNDDNILPIRDKKITVIGDMAKSPRYQGAGSAAVNPYKLENAYNSFLENGIDVSYAKGYSKVPSTDDEKLLQEAINLAKHSNVVVIFAGLTEISESEGCDRIDLSLPDNQNKLIEEICKVNSNVVVALSNGSAVAMPWKDDVKAIVTGYLGGESGAKAMVNCLLGTINPSGKLSETYPLSLEDTPCFNNFPGTELSVEYKESIFVGYRYYDTNNVNILFPFGYGLSYTSFEYSDLTLNKINNNVQLSFYIKNTGNVKGKEIAQIYVSQPCSKIFKPAKELKSFIKVELDPNEEKLITITLTDDDFKYFDTQTHSWVTEPGIYKILVGKSSRDIVLSQDVSITSDDFIISANYPDVYYKGDIQNVSDADFEQLLGHPVPAKHISLEDISDCNSLEQLKNTKVGKYIYDVQSSKMIKFYESHEINSYTRILMDMQRPLKKFYEREKDRYTKEMIDQLVYIAKNNLDFDNCDFVTEFLK